MPCCALFGQHMSSSADAHLAIHTLVAGNQTASIKKATMRVKKLTGTNRNALCKKCNPARFLILSFHWIIRALRLMMLVTRAGEFFPSDEIKIRQGRGDHQENYQPQEQLVFPARAALAFGLLTQSLRFVR